MRDVLELTSAPALPSHEIEIEIEAIDVFDRLRLVDRDKVEMIAASVAESYLHQAIAVSTTPGGGNRYVLVDGEHRIEAHKLLGRATIKAVIRDLTPAERERHEIHANLIRNELTALDRAVFVGRLAGIFEAEHADARNGGDRKSQKWREKNQFSNLGNWSAFSKEAAARTGLGKSSLYRCRDLAASLSPDAIALIRGTKLADKGSQLKALAALHPAEQVAVAREIAEGRAKNLASARVSAGMVPAGGVVRAVETPLMKLEPIVLRLSLSELQALYGMVGGRIAMLTSKPAKLNKGGAE